MSRTFGPAKHYGPDLARLHHNHFGMVAQAAAKEMLRRLGQRFTSPCCWRGGPQWRLDQLSVHPLNVSVLE